MDAVEVYTNLAKVNYTAYVHYVHQGKWMPYANGKYITQEIQEFIEEIQDTRTTYS